MPSGLRFSGGDTAATGVSTDKDITYEMSYLRRKVTQPSGRVGMLKSLFDQLSQRRGDCEQRAFCVVS